jgi:subtilase family serine protease
MKRSIELMAIATAVVLFGFATTLSAQESELVSQIGVSEPAQSVDVHIPSVRGRLIIPKSSMVRTPPAGHKFVAHTNIQLFVPDGVTLDELPPPPWAGFGFETPASLTCVYRLVQTGWDRRCNPYSFTPPADNPSGGSNSIAVVDWYDDPNAASDLAAFSSQFGIPFTSLQFQVFWAMTAGSSCYPSGVPTDPTGSAELEESLDIEWSHAMAPYANIYLVEACSPGEDDLQQAVLVANNLVNCGVTGIGSGGFLNTSICGSTHNPGEVSMGWGGPEFDGENLRDQCANLDDSCFTAPNVVYVAAAGDTPGVSWPCASPKVVCAGGLTNRRNPTTFNFIGQTAWVEGGGGQSAYEAQPSYQKHWDVQTVCGRTWRCVPDLSFDADPYTGVYIYDSFPVDGFTPSPQWWTAGGTSVSAPSLAGIINSAGSFAASSYAELTTIYENRNSERDFTDIIFGYCGPYMGFSARFGWDFCTGVGAVEGYGGE